jgi:hypothetical protein
LFLLIATCVNETGGKFTIGVFDTGGNLPPVLLTLAANLALQIYHWYQQHQHSRWQTTPPVLLIPVANLDLRKSPQIFKKIRNDPYVIFGGLREDNLSQKPEAKTRDTVPLINKRYAPTKSFLMKNKTNKI